MSEPDSSGSGLGGMYAVAAAFVVVVAGSVGAMRYQSCETRRRAAAVAAAEKDPGPERVETALPRAQPPKGPPVMPTGSYPAAAILGKNRSRVAKILGDGEPVEGDIYWLSDLYVTVEFAGGRATGFDVKGDMTMMRDKRADIEKLFAVDAPKIIAQWAYPDQMTVTTEALAAVAERAAKKAEAKEAREAEAAMSRYEKEAAATERKNEATGREAVAALVDRRLIERGIESATRATGGQKTTMRIESFICGRVFTDRLLHSSDYVDGGLWEMMRAKGFTRYVCETEFKEWSLDID